jgi:hypothetical protein
MPLQQDEGEQRDLEPERDIEEQICPGAPSRIVPVGHDGIPRSRAISNAPTTRSAKAVRVSLGQPSVVHTASTTATRRIATPKNRSKTATIDRSRGSADTLASREYQRRVDVTNITRLALASLTYGC